MRYKVSPALHVWTIRTCGVDSLDAGSTPVAAGAFASLFCVVCVGTDVVAKIIVVVSTTALSFSFVSSAYSSGASEGRKVWIAWRGIRTTDPGRTFDLRTPSFAVSNARLGAS